MNNRISFSNLLAALLLLGLQQLSPAYAQTLSFTETQVAEGNELYSLNCASCHGINLEGAAVIPGLSGASFSAKWSEAPLENLATELRQMPPGNQASLSDDDYKSILSLIHI